MRRTMAALRHVGVVSLLAAGCFIGVASSTPPSEARPLGTATDLGTTGSTCVNGYVCNDVSVVCPDLQTGASATVAVHTPDEGVPVKGLVAFFSGGTGVRFYAPGPGVRTEFLESIRSLGYTLVQVAWLGDGWQQAAPDEVAGFTRLACHPATLINYLHDAVYNPPEPQEIVPRGSASTADNGYGSTSLELAIPSTAQPGDVVVAQVSVQGGTSVNITPPVGWTAIDPPGNANARSTAIRDAAFWHVVAAAEPPAASWTLDSAQRATGAIAAYGGVDTSSPVEAMAVGSVAGSTSLVAPSITTSSPGAEILALYGVKSFEVPLAPPADMTQAWSIGRATSSLGYEQRLAIPGSTGTRTLEMPRRVGAVMHTLALRPGGGSAATGLAATMGECGFCIAGFSGGADQIMFPLADYAGIAEQVDAVLPVGGPTRGRVDLGCIWTLKDDFAYNDSARNRTDRAYGLADRTVTGACLDQDDSWIPTWQADSLAFAGISYMYPTTRVHFVIGDQDPIGRSHGLAVHDAVAGAGSPLVFAERPVNTPHDVIETPEGRAAFLAAVTWTAPPG